MTTGATHLTRRHALVALGGVAATSAAIWMSVRESRGDAAPLSRADVDTSPDYAAPLARVCDIVLPATQSGPAASTIGVHDFVALALAHGLEGTLDADTAYAPPENDYLAWLSRALDERLAGSFDAADERAQTEAVTTIDAEAYADRGKPTPWIKIKALILIGYYTSEVGGSEVLRYNEIPGHYDGAVEKTPDMKAVSNDWSAVKYG